jgi:hypothetical protein
LAVAGGNERWYGRGVRRARPLLLTALVFFACNNDFAALVDQAMQEPDQSTGASSSSDEGSTSEAETVEAGTTTEVAGSSTGGEVGGSSEESGPVVVDSAGDPPPVWDWLLTHPISRVLERGPLEISAHAVFAESIELRLNGVSLGVFPAGDEVVVRHEVPIVYDGQDGELTIEGIARSPSGEAKQQIVVEVDLPPGGQDVVTPWLSSEVAPFNAAFALARDGDLVVTLGALYMESARRPVLRKFGADNELILKWRLADWTDRAELVPARVDGFGMGLAFGTDGVMFLAMNLAVEDEEPRGYLAGLTQAGINVFPEVLLAEGEEIEEIVVGEEVIVAVGRKAVPGGRTVAMAWGFDAVTGEQVWAPVKVDVPDPGVNEVMPRSARFHGVTFTYDGNLLAVGSTQVKGGGQDKPVQTRALLVRLSPAGLQLGEPEIYGDQHFFVQTEALAVSPFDSEDGFCWTGWTRNGDFDPELMVVDCRGESLVSWFSSEWANSAGLTIAYTPLTGRAIVGGYRNGAHDAVAIAIEGTGVPFESALGWTYAYDSPTGGLDRVTALACQTYECDVLIASDLLGAPQVRVGRVNQ